MPDQDIAWDTRNPAFYQHSIGIEQEGFAIDGAAWYTPQLYHATATLVRWLARKYHIPRTRAHILGHDNVPGENCDTCIAGQHWDPGPYWNWSRFMSLIGAPTTTGWRSSAPATSPHRTRRRDPRLGQARSMRTLPTARCCTASCASAICSSGKRCTGSAVSAPCSRALVMSAPACRMAASATP